MSEKTTYVVFRKISEDRQIVYGVVYEPWTLDTYGDMMLPEDIEKMAHRYLSDLRLDKTIDVMHDNQPTNCYPIESYVAKAGDPDYPEGSWVLGVRVVDPGLWADIKSGKINGYSFQATVKKRPVVVEIEYDPTAVGETGEANGHTHFYFVRLDENGVVEYGRTSQAEDGHWHEIKYGTATEQTNEHAHRIAI
jgi:hypothetical protein